MNIDRGIEYIAEHYGYEAQSRQCIEEMAELIQAINKLWNMRNGGNEAEYMEAMDHVVDEIADVSIMLKQIKYLLGLNSHVENRIDKKVNRQLQRMAYPERYMQEVKTADYDNLALTPEQMHMVDILYLEKCREVNRLSGPIKIGIKEEVAVWRQRMCPVATKQWWPKCMAYNQKNGKCTGIIRCESNPYKVDCGDKI